MRDSSFYHPTLFSKSKSYFPEIGHCNKYNFLSSGCFLLSILLKDDSAISVPFIKIKILMLSVWRRGKSNLCSMFPISKVYSFVWIIKVSSLFQFTMQKYSNCFCELSLSSVLMFIYIETISIFRILFLKCAQHSFCNNEFLIFPKQVIHILRKVKHISHRIQLYLSEWMFTEIQIRQFFPTFLGKKSEGTWKYFNKAELHAY